MSLVENTNGNQGLRLQVVNEDGTSYEISADKVKAAIDDVATKLASFAHRIIAVKLKTRNARTVSFVLGVMQAEAVFSFVPWDEETLPKNTKLFVMEKGDNEGEADGSGSGPHKKRSRLETREDTEFDIKTLDGSEMPEDVIYVLQTSGTTGEPKSVLVERHTIQDNIDDFIRRYKVTVADTVLFLTSLAFDPSMVELLLAKEAGCRLVVAPDAFRRLPKDLASCLRDTKPSIVQMTPAVLTLQSEETLKWLLGDESPVRVLLIGGERFPIELVRRYRSAGNPTEIYDVYGVTEVSCWATSYRVNHDCLEVKIGEPLKGTEIKVTDSEDELLIGGSRTNGKWIHTGDTVVAKTDGTPVRLLGRVDDQVKLNGVRVNLGALAKQLEKVKGVDQAICLLYQKRFLVAFVVGSKNLDVNSLVERSGLRVAWRPAKVVRVDAIPINRNGKLDRAWLFKVLKDELESQDLEEKFWTLVTRGGRIREELDKFCPLKNYGFTSLELAEMSLTLDANGEMGLMRILFEGSISIEDLLDRIREQEFIRHAHLEVLEKEKCMTVDVSIHELADDQSPISQRWGVDLKKCIDATPVPYRGDVFIGSHAGVVAAIQVNGEGKVKWRADLPDRVEATAAVKRGVVAVGCYDGALYVLDSETGVEKWHFQTGDIIKAEAVFETEEEDEELELRLDERVKLEKQWKKEEREDEESRKQLQRPLKGRKKLAGGGEVLVKELDERQKSREEQRAAFVVPPPAIIYIASYDKHVYKLDIRAQKEVWKTDVGASVIARPFLIDVNINAEEPAKKKLLLVCTLGGKIHALDTKSGEMLWSNDVGSPVFANPILVECVVTKNDTAMFTVPSVEGRLFVINPEKGKIVAERAVKEICFASSIVLPRYFVKESLDKEHDLLALPTRDGNLHVFTLPYLKPIISLKIPGASFVKAPQFVTHSTGAARLLLMSTDGSALIVKLEQPYTATPILKVNGEVFGAVLIYSQRCWIVGSRDNFVRCFTIAKSYAF